MDTTAALFSQAELREAAGIDNETANNWIKRGLLETTDVGGRKIPGRRLFSLLEIYKARLMNEIMEHLMIPVSHSAEIAKRVMTAFVKAEKLSRIADHQEPTPTVAHVTRDGGQWIVELRSDRLQSQARLKDHPFATLPVSEPFIAVHQRCSKLWRPTSGRL